jgi:hypothetical protein
MEETMRVTIFMEVLLGAALGIFFYLEKLETLHQTT